jgi:hypothetical protein
VHQSFYYGQVLLIFSTHTKPLTKTSPRALYSLLQTTRKLFAYIPCTRLLYGTRAAGERQLLRVRSRVARLSAELTPALIMMKVDLYLEKNNCFYLFF